MGNEVEVQATAIGEKLKAQNSGFGFIELIPVIMGLITGLFQLFKDCNNPTPQPDEEETVQNYVTARYSPEKGYKKPMLRSVTARAQRAAKKKGKKITNDQAKAMAIATLDQARTGDSGKIELACSQAAGFDVDLED